MRILSLTINWPSTIPLLPNFLFLYPFSIFHMTKLHTKKLTSAVATISPANPALMDWSPYFPTYVAPGPPSAPPADEIQAEAAIRPLVKPITVADVGCGFGGLLVALSPLLPDDLILGAPRIRFPAIHGAGRLHVFFFFLLPMNSLSSSPNSLLRNHAGTDSH